MLNWIKTLHCVEHFPYRELVVNLLYFSTRTPPDIAHSVRICCRYIENPVKEDVISVPFLWGLFHS